MSSGRVAGKVAFITGAARGQGRSHAVRLAEEGADVIAIDICAPVDNTPYLPATVADLEETKRSVEAVGGRVIAAVADVRDEEALAAVLERGVAEFGGLDIVAANAGVINPPMPTTELEPRLWQQILDINLTGVWNTCRVAAPHMIAAGRGGSIVITSSTAAFKGFANVASYVTTKHGVVGLARSLALELGEHSIRVNHIAPTQVATDMILHDAFYKIFRPDLEAPTKEDFATASEELHALPTPWVEPVDISNALLFLASDEARFITASTLPVDAGWNQH